MNTLVQGLGRVFLSLQHDTWVRYSTLSTIYSTFELRSIVFIATYSNIVCQWVSVRTNTDEGGNDDI